MDSTSWGCGVCRGPVLTSSSLPLVVRGEDEGSGLCRSVCRRRRGAEKLTMDKTPSDARP